MMASGTLLFLMFFVTLKSSNSSYTKLMTYLSCLAFKSFNAAENDTLLYCRVIRWAETPILITESKIKLIRYLLIAYSLFYSPYIVYTVEGIQKLSKTTTFFKIYRKTFNDSLSSTKPLDEKSLVDRLSCLLSALEFQILSGSCTVCNGTLTIESEATFS